VRVKTEFGLKCFFLDEVTSVQNLREEFIAFSIESEVLRFGSFVTKAGRTSPYFFNAGLFNRGAVLGKLAWFYAQTLLGAAVEFDMLYGPAYKGITLASATAVALAQLGRDVPFSYNRKEAKDHGEGGVIVGSPLQGRVVIVDDVISAGTSVMESVEKIKAAGATPCAVLIALDRMERSGPDDQLSACSAVEEMQRQFNIPVISIANLNDVFTYISKNEKNEEIAAYKNAVAAYRVRYGV
jgi:orotate phosphoribosyltransferase